MAAVAHPPPMPAPHSAVSRHTASPLKRDSSDRSEKAAVKVEKPVDEEAKEKSPIQEKKDSPDQRRPPLRPSAPSKFDLEPNPFEQSFSRSSHRSGSSASDRATPPRGGDATAVKHNALPPLSSLTSPAAADPSQFPWLANQSLRTGPLSPAMLAGPKGPNNRNGEGLSHEAGGFDSSTFRTGFTPGTGSGFTPQFGSLMSASNFNTIPLPSPNTAAFLNAVTNATPIEQGSENPDASRLQIPQSHQHHMGHPPSAIPPHLQHHGLSHINDHPGMMPQDTITPNTLSALTGVFNDMNRSNQPPMGQYYPQQTHMHPGQMQPLQPHPQQQQQPGMPPVDYAQQTANAASQAANGLFLLSQAHQELSKREHDDPVPPSAISQKSNGANGAHLSGTKRKSDVGGKAGAKKGKKGSVVTPEKVFKGESTSPSFSYGDDDDDDMRPNSGKPETEEDKRKNFLERNRQAALKCRQRKKAWLGELQGKVESLTMENERLQQTVGSLHEEVQRLSGILMQHRDCQPQGVAPNYGRPMR